VRNALSPGLAAKKLGANLLNDEQRWLLTRGRRTDISVTLRANL